MCLKIGRPHRGRFCHTIAPHEILQKAIELGICVAPLAAIKPHQRPRFWNHAFVDSRLESTDNNNCCDLGFTRGGKYLLAFRSRVHHAEKISPFSKRGSRGLVHPTKSTPGIYETRFCKRKGGQRFLGLTKMCAQR